MKHLQISAILLAAFGTALSTSCSTTKGFGQDLQKVGNRIEHRAESTGGTAPEPASTGIYTQPAAPAPTVPSAY